MSGQDNLTIINNRGGRSRLNWLDAMKSLGVLIIVTGHFCPPKSLIFYVFSVQLFFIISGYLYKNQPTLVFLQKLSKQLIIPMILLGIIYNTFIAGIDWITGDFTFSQYIDSIVGLFIGNTKALAGLWFVYSLILAKVISNFTPNKIKLCVAVVCLACSFYLNEYADNVIRNCFTNTLLAYPLFYIGEVLSKYKKQINNLTDKKLLIGLIFIGIIGVFSCQYLNTTVWMYLGQYGSNIVLFLIGGICGTILCFALCKLLFNKPNKYILLIAEGSIIVLAFQNFFIRLTYLISNSMGYGYYLAAFVTIIFFIPIIILCKKYFPILLGYRGLNQTPIPIGNNRGHNATEII